MNAQNKIKTGIVCGRFQPLHLGHIHDYILPALKVCDELIIGITNPDPSLTKVEQEDLKRSKKESNPFTFYVL